MVKIAELEVDREVIEYYFDGKNYFQKSDDKFIPATKLYLATRIGCEWDKECNDIIIEKKDDVYEAIYIIPIYDWITFFLFANGDTEESAKENVEKIYNDLEKLNTCYEENEERNKKRFMSKIHKFAFFNETIHYFEDSEKDFRELVVECGIPNDARADEPIFGYIDGSKLVFFKHFFKKGEKEIFENFIDCYREKILKHYNIEYADIYIGVYNHEDIYKDEHEYLLEELVSTDFEYYTPIKYLETAFTIEEGTCTHCGGKTLSICNSCMCCGKPSGMDFFTNSTKTMDFFIDNRK